MALIKTSFESLTDKLTRADANPMLARAEHFLKKIQFQPDENILDVGCRDGVISFNLAKKYPNISITALTKSRDFYKMANDRLPSSGLNNLSIQHWDLTRLPFHGQFDTAVSFCFLHWTTDKQWVLKNIAQAIRPKGRVFMQFFPDHSRERFDGSVREVVEKEKWGPYFKKYESNMQSITPGKFAMMAENSGLSIKTIEVVKPRLSFPNLNIFQHWVMLICNYVDYIPQVRVQEFVEEVCEAYFQQNRQDNSGKIYHSDYLLEAELIKI